MFRYVHKSLYYIVYAIHNTYCKVVGPGFLKLKIGEAKLKIPKYLKKIIYYFDHFNK